MAKKSAYAQAGVDIDEMMSGLTAVKKMVKTTNTKGVMSNIGSFGGLFAAPGRDHVLVASTDGVGTKLKVAFMAGKHSTVGQDIVNHCVNDILVQGAEPMFFLDYLGTAKLESKVFKQVVSGICKACRENGCALLGGETAEMPGLYPKGEYDLVGTIIGSVAKKNLITGKSIKARDVIIGLPSSGLHTNGYSLARKIIFGKARLKPASILPGTRSTVASILLKPHTSYLKPVKALMQKVKIHGMAHITGGGLIDNVARILPDNTSAVFDPTSWRVQPIFRFLHEKGKVSAEEMHRVFNMGIGMTIIVRPAEAEKAMSILKSVKARPCIVGRIEKGSVPVKFEPAL